MKYQHSSMRSEYCIHLRRSIGYDIMKYFTNTISIFFRNRQTPMTFHQMKFIFVLILLIVTQIPITLCQVRIVADSLLTELENSTDTSRVDVLNKISKIYEHENPDTAYHYAFQADSTARSLNYKPGIALAQMYQGDYFTRINEFDKAAAEYDLSIFNYTELDDKEGLLKAFNNKGNMFRIKGDYDLALSNFLESLRLSEEVGYKKGIAYAALNVGLIYANAFGDSDSQGLPFFEQALEICQEIDDARCVAYSINNIALVYTNHEEYAKALSYHLLALDIEKEHGDRGGMASSYANISNIHFIQNDFEISMDYNRKALEIHREMNNTRGIIYNLLDLGRTNSVIGKSHKSELYFEEALALTENVNSLYIKSGAYRILYEYHYDKKNFEKALDFYQKYTTVQDSMYSEQSSEQIAEMKTRFETEKKEADILSLTNEKTIQELQLKKTNDLKWFFIAASTLALLLAIFALWGFRQKQKANTLLDERNKLEIENKNRAINLFGQQVSREVAEELLYNSTISGSKKLFVCIMFLDIRDFSPYAEDKEPSEIIQYQNNVFGFMIDIISKNQGFVNQFLGDGFMATFGAPSSSGNDCQNAMDASREISTLLKQKCQSGEIPQTRIGIGLHAGYVVTGNVGTAERMQYSITGNTVILASRIEQLNKKYGSEILFSREVFEHLDRDNLQANNLGSVAIKGRAEMIEIFRIEDA